MRRGTIGGLVAVCAVVVLVAGCGDDDTADTGSPEVSSAGDSTTTEAPSTTGEATGDELADGVHFGYITTLIAGHNEISGQFDVAELLTGEAALEASREAGFDEPTDYYISNVNPRLRPILVDPEAEVLDVDFDDCCEAKPSDIQQFVIDRDADEEERTAVHLTVEDGVVTRIEEQYFP